MPMPLKSSPVPEGRKPARGHTSSSWMRRMSVQRAYLADVWPNFSAEAVEGISAQQTRGRTRPSDWTGEAVEGILQYGGGVRDQTQILGRYLAEEAALIEGPDSSQFVEVLSLANLLECVGLEPDASVVGAGLRALELMKTSSRDNATQEYQHPRRVLLALVHHLPSVYRPAFGADAEAPMTFVPGETHWVGLDDFLKHLAGAIDQGGSYADVAPAFHDYLEWAKDEDRVELFILDELLLVARVIASNIIGLPVADVADWLRDFMLVSASRICSQPVTCESACIRPLPWSTSVLDSLSPTVIRKRAGLAANDETLRGNKPRSYQKEPEWHRTRWNRLGWLSAAWAALRPVRLTPASNRSPSAPVSSCKRGTSSWQTKAAKSGLQKLSGQRFSWPSAAT